MEKESGETGRMKEEERQNKVENLDRIARADELS